VECRYHFSHGTIRYSELVWYFIWLSMIALGFAVVFSVGAWWVSPTVIIHKYEGDIRHHVRVMRHLQVGDA
jgi:hypothetical protein